MTDREARTAGTRTEDRDAVVAVLRRVGPRTLGALREHPDLGSWPSRRLEDAVVRAWSDDRLTVDGEDRLIAL